MEKQIGVTANLKDYAYFLLINHLDELIAQNKNRAEAIQLPLLKFFVSFTDKELYDYTKVGLIHFLECLHAGKGLEEVEESIRQLKANTLPGVPRDEVSASDIVLAHNVRKYSLIKLLPLYTDDLQIHNSIVLELEDFYMKVTELTFKAYVEIQKEKLTLEKEFIETLVNNSIDGILAFDKNLKFTAWNKQLEVNNGLKKEQVIGKHVFDLFPQFQNTPEGNDFQKIFQGEKIYFPPKLYPARDIYVEMNVVPLKNNKGEILGGLTIIHDVTGIKKAEEKIRETKKELKILNNELEEKVKERTAKLEEAINKQNALNIELTYKNQELIKINNDLDNFIYTASHDLKAPISNLEGLMYTLFSELELKESLQPIVGMMNMSIERFKATIRDLTEISKVQKEKTEDDGEINIHEMTQEVYFNVKELIDRFDARIESTFEISSIRFSRKNFRSIIYNLLSNALKYSMEGRKPLIKIATKKVDGYIVLSVEDNGVGIKEAHKSKIFQMFKRFQDRVEGSGIGLYIVKRIIDNSGGRIEVESEEGKGSLFKVYFKEQ